MLLQGADSGTERTVRKLVRALRQNCVCVQTNGLRLPVTGFDPLTDGLYHLGSLLCDLLKFAEAEATYEELVCLLRQRPAESTCANEGYTRLDQALFALGDTMMENAHGMQGAARHAKLQEALSTYQQAAVELRRECGASDGATVAYLGRQAETLLELGELHDASALMAEVWQRWEATIVSKIPLAAITNHPDTLHLRLCGWLIEHALLLAAGGTADAARAERVWRKLEQNVDAMQTVYPAGVKHWIAQWAREALQRARRRRGQPTAPAAARAQSSIADRLDDSED
jgi:tetratricopeptide (TPR) repeat protein